MRGRDATGKNFLRGRWRQSSASVRAGSTAVRTKSVHAVSNFDAVWDFTD
jgi:hypothetical protein